jgi:DNA-directed RNA polymerase subunit RPC12/RpoP
MNMEMKTSATSRCPHCQSDKTFPYRGRVMTLGVILIFLGLLLMPFLIGFPLAIIGLVVLFQSFGIKPSTYSCRTCQQQFKAAWRE